MGFDGFFPPQGIPSNDGQRPVRSLAMDRGANAFQHDPLLSMGPSLSNAGGIEGVTSFQAPGNLDRELATLEALRRSQAALQQKSARFETSSPEAQYLFAMTESLIEEDITRREATISNIFQADFKPRSDSSARSLI